MVGSIALSAALGLVSYDYWRSLRARDGPAPTRAQVLPAASYSATYEARGVDSYWHVRERMVVSRSRLGLARGVRPSRVRARGALTGGWNYVPLSARVEGQLVYERARRKHLDLSRWPPVSVQEFATPVVKVRNGSRSLVAHRAKLTFEGPPRLIYDTDPEPTARSSSEDVETVRVKTQNERGEWSAPTVRARVGNELARTPAVHELYALGFWTPVFALIAATVLGAAAFFPERQLKRWFGE